MTDNIWQIPIGDWMEPICKYYTIKSNFTVEQAREAYFKAVEESGVNIEDEIASEYDNNSVSEKIIELLPEFIKFLCEKGLLYKETTLGEVEYYVDNLEDMVYIICLFIQKFTPEFKFEMINIPILPFIEKDEKGRRIYQFGYGLMNSCL